MLCERAGLERSAAYGALAGIPALVFVPAGQVAAGKLAQTIAYGLLSAALLLASVNLARTKPRLEAAA